MKNKLLNQIFVCLAIIGILIPCFIVPVAADAVDKSVVDLLPASSYQVGSSSWSSPSNLYIDTPRQHFTSVTDCYFKWTAAYYDVSFQSFVLTLYVDGNVDPSSVKLVPYYGGPELSMVRYSSDSNILQYRLDRSVNIADITIKISFSSSYTGTVAIRDYFGVISDIYMVQTFAYRHMLHYYDGDILHYAMRSQQNTVDLSAPFTKEYLDPMDLDWFDQVDIGISRSRLNYTYLDSVSFLIATPYEDCNFSAYLSDDLSVSEWGGAAIYKVLDDAAISSHTTRLTSYDGYYQTIYFYTVTVDLEGVDLSGKMLHLTFDIKPIDHTFTRWSLYYITAKAPVSTPPWYQVFYHWLEDLWIDQEGSLIADLRATISGLYSNISKLWSAQQGDMQDFMTDQQQDLENTIIQAGDDLETSITEDKDNLKSHISQSNNSLKEAITSALQNGFNSLLNGSQAQNSQVSDDVGEMESNSNQLGQLSEDMKVDKPEISGSDVSASSIIPDVGIQAISTPILTIWESPTIVSVLLCAVTIMLVSFVFFGKKG